MVFKTLTLKIHHPSKQKQTIMDEAMNRYAQALQRLLDSAWDKRELLMNVAPLSAQTLSSLFLDKELLRSLNAYHAQPFKDSIKLEFLNLMESYLKRRLKNKGAAFPRVFYDRKSLNQKLEGCDSKGEGKPLNPSLHRAFDRFETGKSVYFCRYSENRDFCLLYEPYKKRFYAKLYLLSQKDSIKIAPQKREDSLLAIVGKNSLLPESQKPGRFILVPLSFGKPQQIILEEALEKPGMLKTARLIKKGEDYYLTISVAVEPERKLEKKSFVGFSLIKNGQMHYTACSLKGELLEQGTLSCLDQTSGALTSDYGLPLDLGHLHKLANAMVGVCERFQAQAVMESYPQYNALNSLMDYKLLSKGLTKVVRVSPFGLWQTCPRCGYNGRSNHLINTLFMCTECGYSQEREKLPSYNLAKRLIKYQRDKIHFVIEPGPNHSKTVRNSLLGIFYTVPHKRGIEDFFDYLGHKAQEVKKLLEQDPTTWTKEKKKLYSLWKKLLGDGDIREAVEIEAP